MIGIFINRINYKEETTTNTAYFYKNSLMKGIKNKENKAYDAAYKEMNQMHH